ncbi:hypothetical protein AWN90_07500 [Nocardia terpenica]|uniref:Uncharacterized protein n=1 Tax=Nocardia terpenica TaxID=455432 RepID=A0A164IP32_9NOCA|nr:hypothetical protein AWN90_07500 [Nocardia terpenica]
MAEYRTREQVEQYLARIFNPDRRFHLYPFETGWLVQPILTPEQTTAGQAVGLTNLVIDSETGVVTEYPSWSSTMIADDHREAKQTGRPPTGRQVYPPQARLSIQRTREDSETIDYDVRIRSQTEPPGENTEYRLTINKSTLTYQPTAHMAANVVSWAEMHSSQDGTWPDEGTWEE